MLCPPRNIVCKAFTLVEVLVVVVVLGILAAVVTPKLAGASDEAAAAQIIEQFRRIEQGHERYNMKYGVWPPDNDGLPGHTFEAQEFFKANPWTMKPPIGYQYNWNDASRGLGPCVPGCGAFEGRVARLYEMIDAEIDDGVPTTGRVRWTGSWGGTIQYLMK